MEAYVVDHELLPNDLLLLCRHLVDLSDPATGALALGKGFSWDTSAELSTKDEHRPRHRDRGGNRGFQRRSGQPLCRKLCSVTTKAQTDLATTGQVLVAAYLAEAAIGANREREFGGPVPE